MSKSQHPLDGARPAKVIGCITTNGHLKQESNLSENRKRPAPSEFIVSDNCDEPPAKKVMIDTVYQDESAFESFMHGSVNIPKIWENIMCSMSGADVVNCMRACKKLRGLIAQCLLTSSKFKQNMDVAATASAIARGRTQSKFQAQFRCKRAGCFDKMCSIDNVWYYQRSETNRINFLQINPKTGKTKESSFLTKSVDSHPSFMVHSTKDPDTIFVQDFYRCLYPLKLSHGHAEVIPDHDKLIGDFGVRHEEKHDRPCYIRYRLFWSGNYGISTKDDVRVFITLGNSNGELDRSRELYRFSTLCFPHVIQLASNEEAKFLLVLPHLVAVHDAKTGEALWQVTHDIDTLSCSALFITKHVAGFKLSDLNTTTATIRLFNTETGDLIEDHKVTKQHLRSSNNIIARGSTICYVDGLVVHVVRVYGKVVKKHSFTFPVEYFEKSKCFNAGDDPTRIESIILEGFVGKSNMLIGNLWASFGCSRVLMSLDVDAAVTAKNDQDVKMAFSLPLNPRGQKPPPKNNNVYLPVYKTDRINECVDLVGVMQRKEKAAKVTLETHYFVTQMDCPSEYCN